MTLSEDERMRQVLDNDEYQRQNETRCADLLHTDNQSAAADSFGRSDAGISPQMFHHRGRDASSDASSGRFYDWPDDGAAEGATTVWAMNCHVIRNMHNILVYYPSLQ
jgi:hypothetical protein